jgi:hypothetical protein
MLQVVASLIDIVIVKRWNISIGIPDATMYMFGFNIIYQVRQAIDIVLVCLFVLLRPPLHFILCVRSRP